MNRRRRVLVLGLTLSPALRMSEARSAAGPFEEFKLVTPAPPGSQPDQIARWLAEPLARRSGARVIVLNRPGAAGAIAADTVRAPTVAGSASLLLGGLDHVAYSHLGSDRRPLDPFEDFVPVGAVNRDSWLVVAAPGVATDIAGLRAAARTARQLQYASTGEGSTGHLVSARLAKALGIEAQHVPYKDSYLPDLVAGRIQFVVAPTPALIGFVRERRLSPLATLSSNRLPVLPDVPTIAELGWPDQVFHGGLFLFVPASLRAHGAQFNAWLAAAMREPDVIEKYRLAGIEPTPLDLDQTRQSVAERMQLVDAMRTAVFGRAR